MNEGLCEVADCRVRDLLLLLLVLGSQELLVEVVGTATDLHANGGLD